jgi:hypothetical protein
MARRHLSASRAATRARRSEIERIASALAAVRCPPMNRAIDPHRRAPHRRAPRRAPSAPCRAAAGTVRRHRMGRRADPSTAPTGRPGAAMALDSAPPTAGASRADRRAADGRLSAADLRHTPGRRRRRRGRDGGRVARPLARLAVEATGPLKHHDVVARIQGYEPAR